MRVGQQGDRLDVYLEGDGHAWVSRWEPATDPTPYDPIMAETMIQDNNPVLYLGRPCYHGHAMDRGCSPILWTDRRYAEEIVDALAKGLLRFLKHYPFKQIVWIGHSGGGALALLLAPRFQETIAVVTLAGNLDTSVWTRLHNYSPLEGSLNPAEGKRGRWLEFHYLGELDKTIPVAVFEPIAKKRQGAEVIVIPGADHTCCWQKQINPILKHLASRFSESIERK